MKLKTKHKSILAAALCAVGFAAFAAEPEAVQLWAGGPLWATVNLGADKPTDYGILTNFYDAAQAVTDALGDGWRLPTKEEFQKLVNTTYCTSTWGTEKEGRIFTGIGDYSSKSIFLPAAGYDFGFGTGRIADGIRGQYWSSAEKDSYYAWGIIVDRDGAGVASYWRSFGMSVRAVKDPPSITPGVPIVFDTADDATNAAVKAELTPSAEVAAVFNDDADAKAAYCAKFGFAVVPTSDGKWAVEAALLPEAWSNLVESAQAATRQIPLGDIASLGLGEPTNVTIGGCEPGFYYSLYNGVDVTNLAADANEENLNILCGANGKVVFPEVAKPSDEAGFFAVGISATATVQPGPVDGEPNLLSHLSFDDAGNGGLNVLKVRGGNDAIVRTTPANVVSGLGAVTVVTNPDILDGLEPGDGAVCIPRGTHLALPIPPALLDHEGHPYTIKMTFNYRWDFPSVSASNPRWNALLNMPASNDTDALVYLNAVNPDYIQMKLTNKGSGKAISGDGGFKRGQWETLVIQFGETYTRAYLNGTQVFDAAVNLADSYADCFDAGGYFVIAGDNDGDDNVCYWSDVKVYDGIIDP